jgi:hypothetical protein
MPRPSFDDATSLPDPFLTYNFNLVFGRGIPGGGDIRTTSFKCQTTAIPGQQIDPVKVPYRGVEINYAGRAIWSGTFDATFLEVRDISTRTTFRRWMEIARDNNLNQGNFASIYKVDADLELYDDVPSLVKVIKVRGMFPLNMADLPLDGSSSQAGQLSITFSYDRTLDLPG